jgi:integrase
MSLRSSLPHGRLMGINACENLEEVQVLLGHTSVQTTERYVGLNSKFVMP